MGKLNNPSSPGSTLAALRRCGRALPAVHHRDLLDQHTHPALPLIQLLHPCCPSPLGARCRGCWLYCPQGTAQGGQTYHHTHRPPCPHHHLPHLWDHLGDLTPSATWKQSVQHRVGRAFASFCQTSKTKTAMLQFCRCPKNQPQLICNNLFRSFPAAK